MTEQEIFDKVVRHLYAQGKPAVEGEGNCRYRTHDGMSCAVGCLIPDDCYNPLMENLSSSMPQVEAALRKAGTLPGGIADNGIRKLLSNLQYAHDHWEAVDVGEYAWSDEVSYLTVVQGEHSLTWPEDIPHG